MSELRQTETWQALVPELPLEPGVPIRFRHSGLRAVVVSYSAPWLVYAHGNETDSTQHHVHARVDLDSPIGFKYALGYLWRESALPWMLQALGLDKDAEPEISESRWRWDHFQRRVWLNQTTDADRLALARALREVSDE